MLRKNIKGSVNPLIETEHYEKPLWCVYGPNNFPTLICCKITKHPQHGLTIWGYSVWEGEPGFRTLGKRLDTWANEHDMVFFDDQDLALNYLKKLTTPKVKK